MNVGVSVGNGVTSGVDWTVGELVTITSSTVGDSVGKSVTDAVGISVLIVGKSVGGSVLIVGAAVVGLVVGWKMNEKRTYHMSK